MLNKIIVSLILILLFEIALITIMSGSFSRWRPVTGPALSSAYRNSASQGTLTRRAETAGPSLGLRPESIPQVAEAEYRPKKYSSLSNYFFAQTRTAHPWASYSSLAQVKGLAVDEEMLGAGLGKLAHGTNRPPQNAILTITDNRAIEFVPHQIGQTLDTAKTRQLILGALYSEVERAEPLALPIQETPPEVDLDELNDLGINELIATGESDFSGSSRARIINIRIGASQYDGLILAPGEEFSFNKYLGPITAARGYEPELVIKPEGLVPEFGGGLCQVSTTAFRAAFFAGMQIEERKNHSIAVSYYRQWINDETPAVEGLDATIYPGAVDMKFVNDTNGALLIWTRIEDNRLYFDFYGTADDRLVAVDGPHPYDRRASGSVRSKVTRTVTKDGVTDEKTFYSNYVSPDRYPRVYEYPGEQG